MQKEYGKTYVVIYSLKLCSTAYAAASARLVRGIARRTARNPPALGRALRCSAGNEQSKRLLRSQRPDRYLELSQGRSQFRLAVTSAAWAGHVLAAAKNDASEIYRTNFECRTVTTGFEALNLLLAHEADFAVVSRAALQRVRADHHPAARRLVELLDLHVTRAESFYYRYFMTAAGEPRLWGVLRATRAEELLHQFVNEQNQGRPKKAWAKVIACDDFDELVEQLCAGRIDGFAGWPFLNLRAERALALRAASGKPCRPQPLKLQAAILKDEQSFAPILHLITTQDLLDRRESPVVLHDLIGKIITACEALNGAANKQKALYETLSPYLIDENGETYLTMSAIDWHLQEVIFDATLREQAFRHLFSMQSTSA